MPVEETSTDVTYRDHLQTTIRNIWAAYDDCSPLRDFACGSEKEAFNTARGKLYDAAIALGALDNALTRLRADTKF